VVAFHLTEPRSRRRACTVRRGVRTTSGHGIMARNTRADAIASLDSRVAPHLVFAKGAPLHALDGPAARRPRRLPSFAAIAGAAGVPTGSLIRDNPQAHLALAGVGEQPPSPTPTSLPVRTISTTDVEARCGTPAPRARPAVGSDRAESHRHCRSSTKAVVKVLALAWDEREQPRRRPAVAGARHLVFVHSTSRAPAGWRACVAGGAEEPRVSWSCPIEQMPTSGCICNSTPSTDARAIRAAVPSPARAVVPDRANAALPELVPSISAENERWRARRSNGGAGVDRWDAPTWGRCGPMHNRMSL
jgi:hypothetical protein